MGTEHMPLWVSQHWLRFEFVAVTHEELNGEPVFDAFTGERLLDAYGLLVSAELGALHMFGQEHAARQWILGHFPDDAYFCFSPELCWGTGMIPEISDEPAAVLEAVMHRE